MPGASPCLGEIDLETRPVPVPHTRRMPIWPALLALLLMGVGGACRGPGAGEPTAPVAPAVETDHPEHDSPIPLPASIEPIAPAIETDHPDAERTLLPPATEAP